MNENGSGAAATTVLSFSGGGPLDGRDLTVPRSFVPAALAAVVSSRGIALVDAFEMPQDGDGKVLAHYSLQTVTDKGFRYELRKVIGVDQVADDVVLTCACCGHQGRFENQEQAFEAGWDVPGENNEHLSTWPISCDLCPGTAALGLIDHSPAHATWEREGRPASSVDTLDDLV